MPLDDYLLVGVGAALGTGAGYFLSKPIGSLFVPPAIASAASKVSVKSVAYGWTANIVRYLETYQLQVPNIPGYLYGIYASSGDLAAVFTISQPSATQVFLEFGTQNGDSLDCFFGSTKIATISTPSVTASQTI